MLTLLILLTKTNHDLWIHPIDSRRRRLKYYYCTGLSSSLLGLELLTLELVHSFPAMEWTDPGEGRSGRRSNNWEGPRWETSFARRSDHWVEAVLSDPVTGIMELLSDLVAGRRIRNVYVWKSWSGFWVNSFQWLIPFCNLLYCFRLVFRLVLHIAHKFSAIFKKTDTKWNSSTFCGIES